MRLFDQMRQDLLEQKAHIEGRLSLESGTFVVKKGDQYYSNGTYSFETPDEFDKRTAELTAFQTRGVVFKADTYWSKKYQAVCNALGCLTA